MSFNHLNQDACTYKKNLQQSVGVGNYFTEQPRIDCRSCFPNDPTLQPGERNIGPIQTGLSGSTCKDVPLIDVSSELLGITRPATNCPTKKFQKRKEEDEEFCRLHLPKTCASVKAEDTRLSNPPCSLRGTGINRWEWLCQNPQDNVTIPFDYNISNRIIAKDNHRPHIQYPVNQAPLLPPHNNSDEMYCSPWMSIKSRPGGDLPTFPSVHWKSCKDIGY